MPFGTSQSKHIVTLLTIKQLGTRWAKHLFSRCRDWQLPVGVGTDGVVVEVPRFAATNYRGYLGQDCRDVAS